MFRKNVLFALLIALPLLSWAQPPESSAEWTRYFNAQFLPEPEAGYYQDRPAQEFEQAISSKQLNSERSRNAVQSADEAVSPTSDNTTSEAEIDPAVLIYQLPDEIKEAEISKPSAALAEQYELYRTQYPIDKQVFDYARIALASVEKNGWLAVNGHLDTYPLRALQVNEGFRSDVQLVNLQWMQNSPGYRQLIFSKLGIQDLKTNSPVEIIRLMQANLGVRMHLSMTLPPGVLSNFSNELAPRGLVFSFNRTSDHSARHHDLLKSVNWSSVAATKGPEYIQALNQNYLAALLIHQRMQLPDQIGAHSRTDLLEQLYEQRPVRDAAAKYLQKD